MGQSVEQRGNQQSLGRTVIMVGAITMNQQSGLISSASIMHVQWGDAAAVITHQMLAQSSHLLSQPALAHARRSRQPVIRARPGRSGQSLKRSVVYVWEFACLSCCAQASLQGAPKDSIEADFRGSLHIISDEGGHAEIRCKRVKSTVTRSGSKIPMPASHSRDQNLYR